ncbi:MAG: FtsK/SpoIIIE domain-containing protein [Gemmataceae bacterium]
MNLGSGTAQHVLVAGKTGSGKSTLLHVLILQLSTLFTGRGRAVPDRLQGKSSSRPTRPTACYARVIAIESEQQFGLSVLQKLDAELTRRGDVFRSRGERPGRLPRGSWKKSNGPAERLPRIFLIVDEFQEFFVEDDKVAQEAALLFDRLVRQGRAFGMHVLLGSQTLGGRLQPGAEHHRPDGGPHRAQCSEADAI